MGMQKGMVAQSRSGRFAGTKGLTDQQARFVQGYISNGFRALPAAREAGYANPQVDAWRCMQNPKITAEIERRSRGELHACFGLALGILRKELEKPDNYFTRQPDDLRKLVSSLAAKALPDRPETTETGDLDSMSVADLEAMLGEAKRQASEAALVIEGSIEHT